MLVNNILGQYLVFKHVRGTMFDHSFLLNTKTVPGAVITAFPLTDYDGEFVVSKVKGSTPLYRVTTATPELQFAVNSIRLVDNIDFAPEGDLYFHLKITHKTDLERIWLPWYGVFTNIK